MNRLLVVVAVAFAACGYDDWASLSEPEPEQGPDRWTEAQAAAALAQRPARDAARRPTNAADLARRVTQLTADAELAQATGTLLRELGRSTTADARDVEQAFALLRDSPRSVSALTHAYEQLPPEAHATRLLVLHVIGSLERLDARAFLERIIWQPLPENPGRKRGITARDRMEMVQARAVDAVAALPDGARADFLGRVAKEHPSAFVRDAAVTAFVWREAHDSAATEAFIRQLPPEMRKVAERPHLERGENPRQFQKQLDAWRKRWGRL